MEILYFSHDCKARDDSKLMKLRSKLGMQGIGIFWCIIEMLYEECGYLNISEYERITYELRTDYDTIQDVLHNYNLFQFKDNLFYSESVLKRLKKQMEKSEKARTSVNKRWELYGRNTNVLQSNNERNTNDILNNNSNNNNNIKERELTHNLEEIKKIFIEKKSNIQEAENFFNYYESIGWKVGKNLMVKMEPAAIRWIKSTNEKIKDYFEGNIL